MVDFSHPHVMGILNCTPDSFSDGGRFSSTDQAVSHLDKMVSQGATMIDVGGESTRPGSDPVSVDEELNRVIPVLEIALKKHPHIYFSIDTTKYEVAKVALELGVDFINDVSGLRKEPRFVQLCSDYDAGIIIMHSVGDPKTMQINPVYSDVVREVRDFLQSKVDLCQDAGIRNIIIDPGFGFGKSLDHNLELLQSLRQLSLPGHQSTQSSPLVHPGQSISHPHTKYPSQLTQSTQSPDPNPQSQPTTSPNSTSQPTTSPDPQQNFDRQKDQNSIPILVGISRKSMLGQLLNGRNAEGRLAATVSAHFYALHQGAKILRVHDVQEAVDSVKVFEALNFSF